MHALCEWRDEPDGTTMILRLLPGRAKRLQVTSTERVRRLATQRVTAGRCRDCGRKRRQFQHRCDRCQRRERLRHRRYPSRFHTIKRLTPADRVRQRRAEEQARFIAALEADLDRSDPGWRERP